MVRLRSPQAPFKDKRKGGAPLSIQRVKGSPPANALRGVILFRAKPP